MIYKQNNYQIMIVAGEASGEAHAARLVTQLKKTKNNFNFYGMGGNLMQQEDVELIENIKNTAVMGIFELLSKLPFLYKTLFKLKKVLTTKRPDILILVDYQAFNMKLAKKAKKLGIKTLFYIGPQVWAWRSYRVKKMREIIDHMAVIFPFEVDFYRNNNLKATYVGHPLATGIKVDKTREEILKQYNIKNNKKIITFLPGSRSSEIANHMPIYKVVMKNLKQNPNIECLVSRYDVTKNQEFFTDLPNNVHIVDDGFYDVIAAADFAVVASGTATLETAILNTPMIVIAKVSKLSYFIYSKLVKVKYISMVNIIANRECVKEFIQDDATPNNIINSINNYLTDKKIAEDMLGCFAQVRAKLNNKPDGSLVDLVLQILKDNE